MALDFGILQPANISGQLQAGQESAMRNQLAQQQLASGQQQMASSQQQMETGRLQQEQTRMQIEQAKREREGLAKMQAALVANGKSPDLRSNFQEMIASGIPHFMDIGIKGSQALDRQDRLAKILGGDITPAAGAPAAPALNVVSRNEGVPRPVPAQGLAPVLDNQGNMLRPPTPEQMAEEERRWAQMAMGGSTKGLAPMLDSKGNLLNPMTPERRALDEQRLQQMADGTAGMAMPAVTGRPIQPDQALNVVSRSEGSPSPIPTANMLAPPPAAPVNALAAPAAPVMPRNTLGLPANEQAAMEKEYRIIEQLHMAGEHELAKSREQRLKMKSEATTPLYKLRMERDALPPNDPMRAIYDARIKKESTHPPGTSVYMPPQEKAFEAGLGTGQSKRIMDSQAAATDAASIIDTVNTGRDIMKSGMITGAGADFLVNLNQGLKTVGIDPGLADAAANSQAFAASMGANVGKLIKQFGAGTGLSNDDRKFAADMAGQRISLDAKAINRILDINEKAARNTITRHNKDVKGIKTNIPLEVEMPPEVKAPAAVTNPQFPGFSIGKP
jgi:hypothetical protein